MEPPTPEERAAILASDRSGSSFIQMAAEPLMLAWLGDRLGVSLAPRRITFPGGARMEVDGASDDPPLLCEAWAHQGEPKPAQKTKVMADAFKLVAAREVLGDEHRLVLLLACDEAARHFRSARSWHAAALAAAGIEVTVAELEDEVRDGIRAAQLRQHR